MYYLKPILSATTVFALLMTGFGVAQASTVNYSVSLINGDFESSWQGMPGWTLGSGTANIRPQGNPINAGGKIKDEHKQFDNGNQPYFNTNNFAVLGDTKGKILGDSRSPRSGLSSISQSFYLPGTLEGRQVVSYRLNLSFQSAFDGNARSNEDYFEVLLSNDTDNITTQTILKDYSVRGSQTNHDAFSQLLTGLSPNQSYSLIFQLHEKKGGRRSTAVGLDNISIAGIASLQDFTADNVFDAVSTTVPIPSAFWLLGSAMAGLIILGKNTAHRRINSI